MLSRLRLGPQNPRGRKFPEPPHPYRNDFQRDRDRVIHSRAFRRLEGKTQVFAAGFGDHFRNRLTHTIEVAQVARTVSAALALNDEYTEVLALAHDLGHPPFGHTGEKALNAQMLRFGSSFEHNVQALRIVDVLEERYARFEGLNLTFEVREGIIKHSRELENGSNPDWEELLPGLRPPLEAQLLDPADEIAYVTADLDDAVAGGLISIEQIGEAVPIFADVTEAVDTQFPAAQPRVRFWEIQRHVMNLLIGGLIDGTIAAVKAAQVDSLEQVRTYPGRLAVMTPQAAQITVQIKALLVDRMYCKLSSQRSDAHEKVGSLFQHLVSHPEHISAGYRRHLDDTPPQRVVCDYIAGMTDGFFLRQYEQLLGAPARV